MEIQRLNTNQGQLKRCFKDLLLLGDEEWPMVERYLDRGDLFVLFDEGEAKTVCVVTEEGSAVEIKNLATRTDSQKRGYGRTMIEFIVSHYRKQYSTLILGTGENEQTLSFYKNCGFEYSHRVPNFFIDHYSKPIIENGRQLIDMIYLKMNLR